MKCNTLSIIFSDRSSKLLLWLLWLWWRWSSITNFQFISNDVCDWSSYHKFFFSLSMCVCVCSLFFIFFHDNNNNDDDDHNIMMMDIFKKPHMMMMMMKIGHTHTYTHTIHYVIRVKKKKKVARIVTSLTSINYIYLYDTGLSWPFCWSSSSSSSSCLYHTYTSHLKFLRHSFYITTN